MRELFEKNDLYFDKKFYIAEEKYIRLLLEYSKTHNITALKDKRDIFENILDSLYVLNFVKFDKLKVCDIGSGAGFPAIHLALALKDCDFYLYEPIAKKSSFLYLIKAKLKLENVFIKTNRIEQEKELKYDFIISRAVTNTNFLLNLCKNVSKKDTRYLFYKGSSVDDEIAGLKNYEVFNRGERNYLLLKEQN